MATFFVKTVLALTLVAPPVIATNARLEVQAPLVTPATEIIEIEQPIPEVLLKIAYCESANRQFDEKGNPLRGVVKTDVGKFQINENWHLKAAKARGYDIYTEEGNTAYALYLYRTRGTQDWYLSASCWKNRSLAEVIRSKSAY